ncbi:ABC transporter ATP-binding protein [Pseudactinotalea sp.]|uniref:ABC transporter ATP-binding protein n=1 Tax=Pseudactinotalea sp. TaxID=1926260 RepID=UPI003B3A73C6
MTAALQIAGASVVYRSRGRGEVHAVDGVELEVDRGEIVGLVGESGSGKSSLARAVVGLERLHAGSITLDGVPVAPLGWRTRADVRTQMVFQSPYASLNPRRTVGSQLRDGVPSGRGDLTSAVAGLLERVGLEASAAARYPHQFSGGQRQRIAIARALAPRPEILVADEPVTALDASAQAQVVELLGSLVRDLGVGMLFISHDLALVRHIADRVAVMYHGQIVEQGQTEQVWRDRAHPYTRELIAAVPRLGAARRGGERS